jgi:hypothetical protein
MAPGKQRRGARGGPPRRSDPPRSRETTEDAEDLKALSEDLAADARRIAEIEDEKSRLDPTDPRAHELALETERLAREMQPKARAEVELTDQAPEDDRPPLREGRR